MLLILLAWLNLVLSKQPWPIKVPKLGGCCTEYLTSQDVSKLQFCLDSIHQTKSKFTLLTFATQGKGPHAISNISSFSVFQNAVATAYAEHNGYMFKFERKPINDDVVDERWHKMQVIVDVLSSSRDLDYLVWLDIDAIVTDFGFKIEDVVSKYPNAEIIASSDIKMGFINTGFMILKNSLWLRRFLHEWWTIGDKNVICDQDAFDMLYTKYHSQELTQGYVDANNIQHKLSEKVVILSMNTLNSHPPAAFYQQPDDPVLHLMGESSLYRALVFRRGFHAICNARSGGILPSQLSLNQFTLLEIAKKVYKQELMDKLQYINSTVNYYKLTVDDFEELSKSSHHYCDILLHIQKQQEEQSDTLLDIHRVDPQALQREMITLRYDMYNLLLSYIDHIRQNITHINTQLKILNESRVLNVNTIHNKEYNLSNALSFLEVSKHKKDVMNNLVNVLKKTAEAGNDLFWVENNYDAKLNIASSVLNILEELLDRVRDDSKLVPFQMKALMNQNLGIMEFELSLQYKEHYNSITTVKDDDVYNDKKKDAYQSYMKHLYSALGYLQSSIDIFTQYFDTTNDSSTKMEHVYSLQIYAAATCTQMNEYIENVSDEIKSSTFYNQIYPKYGTRHEMEKHAIAMWLQTLKKARRNMNNIHLGIHYENYAVVSYNAAMCFNEARKLHEAKLLLQKSIDINNDVTSSDKMLQQQSQHNNDNDQHRQQEGRGIKDKKNLIQLASSLVSQIETVIDKFPLDLELSNEIMSVFNGTFVIDTSSSSSSSSLSSSSASASMYSQTPSSVSSQNQRQQQQHPRAVKAVKLVDGTTKFYEMNPDGSIGNSNGSDDLNSMNDEWVECDDNDPECEDVYVSETTTIISDSIKNDSTTAIHSQQECVEILDDDTTPSTHQPVVFADDDESIFEGLYGEALQELRETRELYTRQASEYTIHYHSEQHNQQSKKTPRSVCKNDTLSQDEFVNNDIANETKESLSGSYNNNANNVLSLEERLIQLERRLETLTLQNIMLGDRVAKLEESRR